MGKETRIEIPDSASRNIVIEGSIDGDLYLIVSNSESIEIKGYVRNLFVDANSITYLKAPTDSSINIKTVKGFFNKKSGQKDKGMDEVALTNIFMKYESRIKDLEKHTTELEEKLNNLLSK